MIALPLSGITQADVHKKDRDITVIIYIFEASADLQCVVRWLGLAKNNNHAERLSHCLNIESDEEFDM